MKDLMNLPTTSMMSRVTGSPNSDSFVKYGKISVDNINSALQVIGKSISDFPCSLEFGCGCGRLLLHLEDVAKASNIHGVDIDPIAIEWVDKNIPWVAADVCNEFPPLKYSDEYFDLVFNHSVFSHLDELHQNAWLTELYRVVKPGGALVLTVAGEYTISGNIDLIARLKQNGFVFLDDPNCVNDPFVDYYRAAFHTPQYVFERWGKIFDIKAYIVRGALDFQDVVLLRKRSPETQIRNPERV